MTFRGPKTYQLSDLYDADQRVTDPRLARLAASTLIPHPLRSVQYADGVNPCTHGKRHDRWSGSCPWNDKTVVMSS